MLNISCKSQNDVDLLEFLAGTFTSCYLLIFFNYEKVLSILVNKHTFKRGNYEPFYFRKNEDLKLIILPDIILLHTYESDLLEFKQSLMHLNVYLCKLILYFYCMLWAFLDEKMLCCDMPLKHINSSSIYLLVLNLTKYFFYFLKTMWCLILLVYSFRYR